VNVELLAGLLDELAERVAGRVLAELAARPGLEAPSEQWRLLDVEEVAGRLGRSTRWVRERAKRGDLPWVRLDGGALAFDPDDVRAFVRERRIACSPLAGAPGAVCSSGFPDPCLPTIQKARGSAGRRSA